MPALPDLQQAFADHLAGRERHDLVALVRGDRIPAAARLAIHRNHLRHSLTTALAATFPTVQALVGEAFFARLARDFVARGLPAQPVLTEYGGDLPSFIAGYAPAETLPYLSDIARLDWALNVAFHAGGDQHLTVAQLAAIPAGRLPTHGLVLVAGSCLIESAYPLDRIWQASQTAAGEECVDASSGGCRLLVLPGSPSSFFVGLSVDEAAFLAALGKGETLEIAAGMALAAEAAFDLSASFARLLQLGVFAAVR